MNAVMYGGGNIGRGFVGALLSASGYRVTFVDVAKPVVDALNEKGCYPVRILKGSTHEDVVVKNVCAVDGNDRQAVAEAIANGDIMATAVGVNILKFIIPNLVAGIRLRMARGGGKLNIIICENLMDANKVLEGMLKEQLNLKEKAWFDENIGLVEASIGRMVPVQTEQMKDGDPMRVCVESYGFLPVDRAAFKGEIPEIQNLVPFVPFDFYIKRKLYIHNMGHATCAYLGGLMELPFIYQSIAIPQVRVIVQNAMQESALALSRQYGVALEDIYTHIEDLLYRFTNEALQDTCQRVGGDPKRKLSADDRLIGASRLAARQGICPAYMAIGCAAAVYRYIKESEDGMQSAEKAVEVLETVSRLSAQDATAKGILHFYEMLLRGDSLDGLIREADELKAQARKPVI